MKNKKLSVALDCDDVLFDCVPYAINRVNKKTGLNVSITQVTGWGKAEGDANLIFKEWTTRDFFENQPIIEGSKEFIHELSQKCEIYIATAIEPQFMDIRIRKIMENFPEINPSNIYMGSSKDKIKTDVLLDDGFHNIRNSIADYPVLLRKNWNKDATGVLTVNTYDEFLKLIDIIKNRYNDNTLNVKEPKIIALIGPTGTRKNKIIEEITKKQNNISRIKTYTTDTNNNFQRYKSISMEKFANMKKNNMFFEYTMYAGHGYGSKKEDLQEELLKGNNIIIPMDICGIISLKTNFKDVVSIYIDRNREDVLYDIISRNIPDKDKVKRIVSLDMEKKNKRLCDYIIDGNKNINEIVKEIMNII